jgi:periplasmic protein TonB
MKHARCLIFAVVSLFVALSFCGAQSTGIPSAKAQEQKRTPPPENVEFDKEPVALKRVNPTYPEEAKKKGLEGTVYVSLWVDREGKIQEAKVLKSDNAVFEKPAIDAAKQWNFSPALKNGKPVDVWLTVPFKFKLAKE